MRAILSVLAVLALLATDAAAADPAEVLRGILGPHVKSGAWERMPEGGGERLVVPDLVYAVGSSEVHVPRLEAVVTPTDNPERHRVMLHLPEALTAYDADGVALFELRIAENRFDGIWSESLGNFLTHDLQWRNLAFVDRRGGGSATIGTIELRNDPPVDGPVWTGTNLVRLRDLRVDAKTAELRIGELALEARFDNMPVDALLAWVAAFRAAGLEGMGKEPSAEERARLADLFAQMPGFGDRVSIVLKVASLSADAIGAPFGFAGLAFEEAFARQADRTVELTFGIAIDGLALGAEIGVLAPDRGGLTLRLGNIPADPLWAAFVQTIRAGKDDPAAAEVLAQLLRSNARVKLDAALGGASYSGVLASTFRVEPGSPRGYAGEALATLAGLDETLQLAMRPPVPAERQQTISMLQALKAFGAARSEQGKVVYDYRLTIDEAGKLLLNGQDLEAGAAPAPTPQPKPKPKR